MYFSSVTLLAFGLFAEISGSKIARTSPRKQNKQSNLNSKCRKSKKDSDSPKTVNAVFTMTNGKESNEIIMYSRNSDGKLTLSEPESEDDNTTGGNGGAALDGNSSDPLGSQDSIIVAGECLIAVNAGSNTITSFLIETDKKIAHKSLVPSGGSIPISLTEHCGVLYVLNAGDGGNIHGFTLDPKSCKLTSIADSKHLLGQARLAGDPDLPMSPPLFSAPTQISFTPNGRSLLVSIKGIRGATAFGGSIIQFRVDRSTFLAESNPTENLIGTDSPFPFSFDFNDKDRILLVTPFGGMAGEDNPNGDGTVLSYRSVAQSMGISRIDRIILNGAQGTCWIKYNDGCAFTTDSDTNSISGVSVNNNGMLSNSIVAAVGSEEPGKLNRPLDLNFSGDGFLYVLSTNSDQIITPAIHVYERANNDDCTLTEIQVISDGLTKEVDNDLDNIGVGTVGIAVY